ncbi:MAG: efflux RND transporter periplasmic adaptor subunit [Bacteroides sp.]|nr:efflux RND transporter periplasmic adaptor subunit [Eubacterium sp.]MCM1417461.1 efflux RND transporter periplasmic adaptor subunit [Roseburia sp.]MCM1461641.1 efflux RND transporter periplasmic adaptor subunit [Bacteroides sp.]
MRKKILAAAAVLMLSSCSDREAIDAEIKIPILGAESAVEYQTTEVTRGDLYQTANVAGNIGYLFADQLFTETESNLLEVCVSRGDRLKEGDPIAVFDSSSLDYDYNSQKILADNAYAAYLSSGGEAARLEYEIRAKELEYLAYQRDLFTIRAPYDCVITSVESGLEVGSVVPEGTLVCTVAKENDIYVYTTDNTDSFRTGIPIAVKFGSSGEYQCRVVMTPESGQRGGRGSVNPNACVVLKFEEGELERLMAEVDNVLSAGWATLIVPTVQKYDVMLLPEEAVKNFSGSTYCSLLDGGRRVRVPVEVDGIYNGTAVILSGVSVGDEIAY